MNANPFHTITIPTYIINLKSRHHKLNHLLSQFAGKSEFDVQAIEACEHKIGAIGLWQSMQKIVKKAQINEDDVIIIVEDDHTFTEHYNRDFLIQNILEAAEQGCDILLGGIGGDFSHAVPLTINRYWINHFEYAQFIVVFSKFFQQILKADFEETDKAYDFLSELTANKMVLYPFISIKDNVEQMSNVDFDASNKKLGVYMNIYEKYIMHNKDL